MDKLKVIIKREYLTRVKSKGFIIGTIISPLIMMSFVLVPLLVARSGGPSQYRVAVLDQNADSALYERFAVLLEPTRPSQARYELQRLPISPSEDLTARRQQLDQQMKEGALDAYLILPPDTLNRERLSYRAKNISDFEGRGRLEDALNKAIFEQRVTRAGLQADSVRELTRDVRLEISNERGESERSKRGAFIMSFGLLMIIYITILVYGVMVMRGVMEEKQSRIIEVLLSSVRPFELMLGKLIGIGLVGLTQYLTWGVLGLLLSGAATLPALAMGGGTLLTVSLMQVIFFIVFFVLGYFLYATLYAMVGAMVTSEEDGQQVQMPITMTIIIPVMLATLVMRNPNGTAATILSLIPFFTPVLMFLRIGLDTVPWWQIALSIVLMLGTILGAVWIAAKIYRVGVLMYGKRPTIPELMRWLKYT
jgi:ABC-2 type transport system permease protein